jgi:hypothetical protein
MDPLVKIAFILCAERGVLERTSVLFARSLRQFGGRLRDAPIHTYAPRHGFDIGAGTKRDLEKLEVTHHYHPLNLRFPDYPLANKPFVAAFAERTLAADVIVFADSDMIVLSEPSALIIPEDHDVGIRPVDLKGIGVSDERDEEYPYWHDLYGVCGVKDKSFVKATVSGERIFSYWNTGLIASRTTKQLFSGWLENFTKVMSAGLIPKAGRHFVEQSSFAASALATKTRVFQLPNAYNYPIHLHAQLPITKKIKSLDDMVIIHYHSIFQRTGKYADNNPLAAFLNCNERSRWLIKQLKDTRIFPSSRLRRFVETFVRSFGASEQT